jgi:hypothetical protein
LGIIAASFVPKRAAADVSIIVISCVGYAHYSFLVFGFG